MANGSNFQKERKIPVQGNKKEHPFKNRFPRVRQRGSELVDVGGILIKNVVKGGLTFYGG